MDNTGKLNGVVTWNGVDFQVTLDMTKLGIMCTKANGSKSGTSKDANGALVVQLITAKLRG